MPLNLPNLFTLTRIALTPLFLLFLFSENIPHHVLISLVIFSIGALTDWIDGRLARSRGQITNFGKIVDPIADKLLVLSALFAFMILDQIQDLWIWVIVARELLVTGLRAFAATRNEIISASILGKWKTASQFALIIALFITYSWDLGSFGLAAKQILTFFTVAITLLSGFEYLYKSRSLFRATS